MDHSPSGKANNHAASPEIPRLLWKPKVHYRSHKIPLLAPVLSQMDPVHTLPPYFSKVYSNIIFPFTLVLPSGLFLQVIRPEFCMHFSSLPCLLHAPPISYSL